MATVVSVTVRILVAVSSWVRARSAFHDDSFEARHRGEGAMARCHSQCHVVVMLENVHASAHRKRSTGLWELPVTPHAQMQRLYNDISLFKKLLHLLFAICLSWLCCLSFAVLLKNEVAAYLCMSSLVRDKYVGSWMFVLALVMMYERLAVTGHWEWL